MRGVIPLAMDSLVAGTLCFNSITLLGTIFPVIHNYGLKVLLFLESF